MSKNFILLASVVTSEFNITMDLFWDKVGSDYNKVCKQIAKTQDLNEIKNIIKEYI